LFQQKVLPSIAYIGGAGELAYWMELKPLFEYYNINYPLILLRNHILPLSEKNIFKWYKLGFKIEDIFKNKDVLKKEFIHRNTTLEIKIEEIKKHIIDNFEKLKILISDIDTTLIASAESEKYKQIQGIEHIYQKLIKAEKKKSEDTMNFIEKFMENALPDGGLKERKNNILEYIDLYGFDFIHKMYNEIEPFSKELLILPI
jgi:uncharacterized protein YllA (UPF0747 family)